MAEQNTRTSGKRTIIGYFKRRQQLTQELAEVNKQQRALERVQRRLENKLDWARQVTEVYRGYPLTICDTDTGMPFGVALVTFSSDYITAKPYQAASGSARFKKGSWIIRVLYRPCSAHAEREETFFVGLPPREKAKAYELAKDVVVALAGGRSTKLAAEWAEKIKNRRW